MIFLLSLGSLGFHTHRTCAQAENPGRYREVRHVMGTLLDITVFDHDEKKARRFLDEAFSLAQRLDDLLSNYKPQSEVNRLNRRAGEGRVKVSPELYEFLGHAKSLSQKAGGAFAITVGPLVQLWKETQEAQQFPSTNRVQTAKRLSRFQDLILHRPPEVELRQRGMSLDTGGLGKGYAADQIASLLTRGGIKSALINFGHSSIRAIGAPPGKQTWKLLLEFNDKSLGVTQLKDQALSASDTFGRPMQIGEQRFGHIIDPESGSPVSERIYAVVVGPSATEAEALSKYVILRGWKTSNELEPWGNVRILRIAETGGWQYSEGFPLSKR